MNFPTPVLQELQETVGQCGGACAQIGQEVTVSRGDGAWLVVAVKRSNNSDGMAFHITPGGVLAGRFPDAQPEVVGVRSLMVTVRRFVLHRPVSRPGRWWRVLLGK